ncbi:B4GALNT2 [Branchiostoma lanceolatum]|uniref:B4GALNT2 protein n=1 Tax=Branchiostoma lanceolatum TaxID=7740 RepID=A0A8J9YRC2_BRALA|nr:B4GALNT2 [Branchiostoma lanceolatum]
MVAGMKRMSFQQKLLVVSVTSFFLGCCLGKLWCLLLVPCGKRSVRIPYGAVVDVNSSVHLAGFHMKTILMPVNKGQHFNSLPRNPDVERLLGEKSCECSGRSLKDYFAPEDWTLKQRQRDSNLRRFNRRRFDPPDVYNHADGLSPVSYPAHGVVVRPLRAVLLEGVRVEWFEVDDYFRGTVFEVEFSGKRGVFTVLANIEDVNIVGDNTDNMFLQTTKPIHLNQQLQKVVYRNTEFNANIYDLVKIRYMGFTATIPVHIQHRQLPWLYEPEKGKIGDRVTVVVAASGHYDSLRRLVKSVEQYYPKTTVIVADDNPADVWKAYQVRNVKYYRMPHNKGYFAGLNLGISQVATEYVLIVDDDQYFTSKTKLRLLVSMLDHTNYHLVGGSVENPGHTLGSSYRILGNATHACLESQRQVYHEIKGYPGCHAADHVESFFLASTADIRVVGFDPHPAQARTGRQGRGMSEFFVAALGRLRIAVCRHVTIEQDDAGANTSRQRRAAESDMEDTHSLLRNNLTCRGQNSH